MSMQTLKIKNMVCDRCIASVKKVLESNGYRVEDIGLGTANVQTDGQSLALNDLNQALKIAGFELIHKPGQLVVERIKESIRDLVRSGKLEHMHVNVSVYLEKELGKDYSTLTHLFGSHEQVSLERYTILQKVEQAKEWLQDTDLAMTEIALRLGYSSAAYFSNQFKQITGQTPSQYRHRKPNDRIPIDQIGMSHPAH